MIPVDRRSARPLYRQLYDGYREAILERRLRPGQRLPSTRALAAELGISRIPVLQAFDQLLAEGYCESRPGSGTFVSGSLPDPRPVAVPRAATPEAPRGGAVAGRSGLLLGREPEPWLDGRGAFRMSQPAVDLFPFKVWSQLVNRHAREPFAHLLQYGEPMGHAPFREAIAAYLRTSRAVRCEASQILVVSGSQQALDLTARVLLDPGSRVWVEEPGYGGARDALTMAGARLVPVPVDGEGLDVAAGIALCKRARAAYVTPSHQYPMGATLSASRRLQLLSWAERAGAFLIEDDYDSEYRYDSPPIASLQGLDRSARVIYIGTFSKVLFPALRLGYLVVPEDLVDRFASVRDAMDIFPPTFPQAVLTDFLTEGHFTRHIRRMRLVYRERREALVDALRSELSEVLDVQGGEAGMHLVATFRKDLRDRPIALRAARKGLWTTPLSSCHHGNATRQGLVLGYGGTDVAGIREGVRRLRAVIRST
ncbi:MAG: PLP-dependent aminotransferase family protein [Acidobacteria bacterium]|nr:PLP-dependent aminotransferase family protein [Acidobacteriota bacterium]